MAERCPELEDMAQEVANKHGRALLLFFKCHQKFNSQERFTPDQLLSLRKYNVLQLKVCTLMHLQYPESDINDFLSHYRTSFPSASVMPKLHMMEDHIVDFLSHWGVGIGMLGEHTHSF